jgi:hypothetical protein
MFSQGEKNKAFEYLEKALAIRRKHSSKSELAGELLRYIDACNAGEFDKYLQQVLT